MCIIHIHLKLCTQTSRYGALQRWKDPGFTEAITAVFTAPGAYGIHFADSVPSTKRGEMSLSTLPETNIAPARSPSPKETCLPTIHFQVLC